MLELGAIFLRRRIRDPAQALDRVLVLDGDHLVLVRDALDLLESDDHRADHEHESDGDGDGDDLQAGLRDHARPFYDRDHDLYGLDDLCRLLVHHFPLPVRNAT